MTVANCVFEFILPAYLILAGAIILARPPRFGSFWAYRGDYARKNQETWAFAQKLMGKAFLLLGIGSAAVVLLIRCLLPAVRAVRVISIPVVLFLIFLAPCINNRLKRQFPELLSGKKM